MCDFPSGIFQCFFTSDILKTLINTAYKFTGSVKINFCTERDAASTTVPQIKALMGI
jgi:hypothetical protein